MVRDYCNYTFQNRWFPKSDFLLRSYTILGLAGRVSTLFRDIWSRHNNELSLVTISNMIFIELGSESLDINHVNSLVSAYHRLSVNFNGDLSFYSNTAELRKLSVNENQPLLLSHQISVIILLVDFGLR